MVAVRGVVDPIFQVVLVPALVVQPGRAVSFGLALGVVGAASALPVLGTGPELHRRELAQIMGQPLPVQPAAEAVLHHQHFMMMDRFIMLDRMPQSKYSFSR